MNGIGDFAQPDFDRAQRCGFPEVVYAAGKTPQQVALLSQAIAEKHGVALATRASADHAAATAELLNDAVYVESCGILFVDRRPGSALAALQPGASATDVLACNGGSGQVVVCCAGTSDLPVAQEAAITARLMGSAVTLLTDVGVAGVHRILAHEQDLQAARAIVAVAGMEGALPSLVAGLVDVCVIAVPTSVGYGASMGGIAALLGMLNSCAGGVSVVNIDNGFGAGVIAHRINMPPLRFKEA
jgi:NCAIR mutase (PurE)-related protein